MAPRSAPCAMPTRGGGSPGISATGRLRIVEAGARPHPPCELYRAYLAVAADRPAAPLPVPPTPLIGREDEIAEVTALLRDLEVRLVTLIGPGGIGKTRLAIEVARRMLGASGQAGLDGASFIDLAGVRDAAQWPDAVTAALGLRPEGTRPVLDLLIDQVQGRRLLLVLDNVEQLVAAAADLGTLLAACPDLTVLVTSRIVPRLRGEHEVPLAPLPTPGEGPGADASAVGQSAAVRLLVARAGRCARISP